MSLPCILLTRPIVWLGAYSCEAINSMGSCFAGSAGCGQPGQDAIVVSLE